MDMRHTRIATTLGTLTLVTTGDCLTGLYFPGHTHPPKPEQLGAFTAADSDAMFTAAATQLGKFLTGGRTRFELPVAPDGDEFSRRVWEKLTEIPFGRTITYGMLAEDLGNRHLAQRVGQAVGHNPISIIIPSHRVIGADGSLTGYAAGLDRKRRLLELEEPAETRESRLF